jgi:MFS family permease
MRGNYLNKRKLATGISLNVLFLGFTSFLTDVSSEMVFALLPFYMVSLGTPMIFVGVIEGAAETTASILKIFSGWFSDKVRKRKPFAVFGYSLSAILKPLFAFAIYPIQILLIRISERFGKGIRTAPRDALIADSIGEEDRGKAYGFHRTLDTLGAVFGPLLAFLLFPLLFYRGVFLVSFIPAVLAVLLLIVFVKEGRNPKTKGEAKIESVNFKLLSKNFMVFIFIVAIFTFGNFSYAFFLLQTKNFGIDESVAILLYLLFNVSYAFFAFPLGTLSDKIGKKPVVSLGYGIFGITCLLFAYGSTPFHGFISFILYGLSFAIVDTVQRAIIPDLVPHDKRGTAFGLFHAVVGLVTFPSSLVAGALWEAYGAPVPFLLSSILSLLAAIFILFTISIKEKNEEGLF